MVTKKQFAIITLLLICFLIFGLTTVYKNVNSFINGGKQVWDIIGC
jgi:hypothetical protein